MNTEEDHIDTDIDPDNKGLKLVSIVAPIMNAWIMLVFEWNGLGPATLLFAAAFISIRHLPVGLFRLLVSIFCAICSVVYFTYVLFIFALIISIF